MNSLGFIRMKKELMEAMRDANTWDIRCRIINNWFKAYVHEFHADNSVHVQTLESVRDREEFERYENERLAHMVGKKMYESGVLAFEPLDALDSDWGTVTGRDYRKMYERNRASLWVIADKVKESK